LCANLISAKLVMVSTTATNLLMWLQTLNKTPIFKLNKLVIRGLQYRYLLKKMSLRFKWAKPAARDTVQEAVELS